MPLTAREVARRLLKEGWREDRQRGSHRIFKHPAKGTISVPNHSGNISRNVERDITKKAGW